MNLTTIMPHVESEDTTFFDFTTTSANTPSSSPADYLIFHIGSGINRYGPPVIVAFGTVGNTLSLVVMGKGERVGSGSLYVITLAVLDTIMLWLGLLQYWFLFR